MVQIHFLFPVLFVHYSLHVEVITRENHPSLAEVRLDSEKRIACQQPCVEEVKVLTLSLPHHLCCAYLSTGTIVKRNTNWESKKQSVILSHLISLWGPKHHCWFFKCLPMKGNMKGDRSPSWQRIQGSGSRGPPPLICHADI